MSPELEKDLLQKIAAKADQQAFQLLFENYTPRIKGFMVRSGADPALADDLAQEALSAVWRKAHLYAPDKGNPSTWIFTIVRNLRIDKFRKERVWQPLPEDHAEIPSDDLAPDELASRQERLKSLQEALGVLPSDQLEVITLSYLDGLAHSEIASRLNLPIGTVKSRMRLAYEKLRPLVEKLR
jgi:RNA polymerase sigma-70 factor (ECF subfamily)